MAFYKNDSGTLLVAPNFVQAPSFSLLATDKDTYELPIDGWHWFDTEKEARLTLNVLEPVDD